LSIKILLLLENRRNPPPASSPPGVKATRFCLALKPSVLTQTAMLTDPAIGLLISTRTKLVPVLVTVTV
jgi:hypothetical protein